MASLKITNSTENCSFTVQIVELDTSYSRDGRTFICEIRESGTSTWYSTNPRYEGSIDAYASSVDASNFITAMLSPGGIVINDIQPYTLYDIRVTISGITGGNTNTVTLVVYEHKSGYGDIEGGVPSVNTPQITEFTAQQTSKGTRQIKYSINVTHLNRTSSITGAASAVHVRCLEQNGNRIDTDYYYSSEDYYGTDLEANGRFNVPDFGTYIIELYAINMSDSTDDKEVERYITVEVKNDAPDCKLTVEYNDIDFSYDNGRVMGTIKNYPIINADDWNQFCIDINIVRAKAYPNDEEWVFEEVQSGSEMKASLFQNLYDAIENLCPSGIIAMPEKNLVLESNKKADGEAVRTLITKLATTLQACRDYYWEIT